MNKTTLCFILVLAVSCLCHAGDDNQQHWAATSFSFRLNDNWEMKIKEDFRFRNGEHFEQHNEILFTYKGFSDMLDLGLGFRQVHQEDSSHEWQRENRPYVELSIKKEVWGLKCSDRNRLEFRDFENKKDVFRYRNRLKLASTKNLFDLPLRPYIADEIYIQEESGYNRNRIYAGVVWDVNKTLDIDFFFIHQKDKTTHGRDDVFITGFETIFSF
ncbi:MAG: DUF2490 domain-containing protein [Phycisphaerae bacterium]|nr:DUF2490 domain-containing protein [Phycisphaerae bacterium]